MRKLLKYEAFKSNNGDGELIGTDDIQQAIENGQKVKARNVEGMKGHDENRPLEPIDVDDDAENPKATVRDEEGNIGTADLEDVTEIIDKNEEEK